MAKWIKTSFPGVRYRKHPTRKHGVKMDQYFTIRYKIASGKKNEKGKDEKKDKEEGLGWSSEGWTEKKAYDRLRELKENQKVGEGPQTLAEKRAVALQQKETDRTEQERQERESVTFGKFFIDTYLPQAKADKKDSSVAREEGLFNNWMKEIMGDIALRDVVPFHMEMLKKTMSGKGQSPRSIEYALAVIRQVFNTAKRSGAFLGESPTANVKRPKVDNGRMRFLTRSEADKLLTALKDKSTDIHDMTLLSLHAGLRFGEIASLTWQDVDLKRGVLTIRDAKAGSRFAFLTVQAEEMLKSRTKGKPSDFVFPQRTRKDDKEKMEKMKKISHSFFRIVDKLKLNEGIDDPRLQVCFHTCRHSYASWMIEQGADLYTVQKLLGHKTNVMTQRYAHMSENRLRDAAKALGQAWKNQPVQDQADQDQAEQGESLAK